MEFHRITRIIRVSVLFPQTGGFAQEAFPVGRTGILADDAKRAVFHRRFLHAVIADDVDGIIPHLRENPGTVPRADHHQAVAAAQVVQEGADGLRNGCTVLGERSVQIESD